MTQVAGGEDPNRAAKFDLHGVRQQVVCLAGGAVQGDCTQTRACKWGWCVLSSSLWPVVSSRGQHAARSLEVSMCTRATGGFNTMQPT